MSFPYYIIDGTFYSFCTTSCIHVNLTKIALSLIEDSIIDSLHSSIFSFLRPAVSCRFRGAKIKPFISFHQIFREKFFEWILLLNGVCFFTRIWEDNSYRASRRCISSLSSLPLSKAGAKVHGLSSHPNLTTILLVLNYAWSLIFRYYEKTIPAIFYRDRRFKRLRNTCPSIIAVVSNYADLYA